MKEGWELKRLIDIAKFIDYRGRTPKKTDSGIRLITAKNVKMGILNKKPEEFIAEEDYDDWMTRGIPEKGDVLFTTEAPLSMVALLDTSDKIALAQRIITLSPNRNILFGEYLHYCLQSKDMQDDILSKGTGATVTGIKSKLLKEVLVPIPPLSEQKQIVTILDIAFKQIDQAKANLEKNLNNAKELFQSKLNEVFSQKGEGWEEKKLGDVCEKNKNIKWSDNEGKEFQYIDLSSVSRKTLKIEETTLINSKIAPSRAKKIVNKLDVIFATTRPTLKRVTLIAKELDNQICSTGFIVLKSKKDLILSELIYYFLQTTVFMNRMEELQRGASYPAVSDKDVNETIINFPISIDEQKETIIELDKFSELSNNLQTHYQQKLNNLEELKKSILQKAFKGELT